MSQGLETTFRLLEETENEAASRVLIPALDSPFPVIRDRAFGLLLKRGSPAGHREIVARLHTFDEPWRAMVQQYHSRLVPALREAIVSTDRQMCINGCRAAVWLREYDLIPPLLIALEEPDRPDAGILCETLGDLAELLCEEVMGLPEGSRRPDVHLVRRRVVSALEDSVSRFGKHRRREILEAFLLLTYRDNAVLQQVLHDPHHPAFVVLIEALSKSQHDAVLRLLLSFLDGPRAPSAILSVVSKRTDPRFVQLLLQTVGPEPSPAVVQNLKRLDSLGWVRGHRGLWDSLEELEQLAAVRMVMQSAIPRTQAFSLIEHLLLHGKPGARRAAAEALEQFRGADANLLASQAADDPDPEVQARILVQLRSRGIPGALARLVEMIDSPHAVVRDAARQCLAEFSFPRFLASFDLLDEEVRRSTGELVKKADPETVPLLRAELTSPVRSRRLRGLAVARALDLASEVEDLIIPLLKQGDFVVRAEAALSLAKCTSSAAREALTEALRDRSLTVQDAARKSLGVPAPVPLQEVPPSPSAVPTPSPPADSTGVVA